MGRDNYWEFRLRKVRRIVDGDTYDLEVDLGFRQYGVYRFRLADVDTPEVYGVPKDSEEYSRGVKAITFVSDWFAAHIDETIWVRTYEEQTFNRWVCEVHAADSYLGDELVKAGHAEDLLR